MKYPLDTAMLQRVERDAAPVRNLFTIHAKYMHQPMNAVTANALHCDAIDIWEQCRARGETMPNGNDMQCLLLIHRIAQQLVRHGIAVPDFLFLSVSEYEQACNDRDVSHE